MSKFKVGDRVRVVSDTANLFSAGQELVIKEKRDKFDLYFFEGNYSFGLYGDELELVTSATNDTSLSIVNECLKPSNPKDAIGVKKVPISVLPSNVVQEMALGMFEGAVKYGRHNYRVVGVRASVYYDATMRHLMQWWEGEDIDKDSGLSHITKAMSSLCVLRDAMLQDKLSDDRPPKALNQNFTQENNDKVKEILGKYKEHIEPYTEVEDGSK